MVWTPPIIGMLAAFFYLKTQKKYKNIKTPSTSDDYVDYTKYLCGNIKIPSIPDDRGRGIQGLRKHEALLKKNLNPSSLL